MKFETLAPGRVSGSVWFPCLVYATLTAAAGCSSIHSEPTPSTEPAVSGRLANDALQRLIKKGRSQFLHCSSCHVVDASAPAPTGDSLGPHLKNIVGRPVASVEGFTYTEAFKALDLIWDERTLDAWLQQPETIMPEMCAPFSGIKNSEHRKALIAYLKNPRE